MQVFDDETDQQMMRSMIRLAGLERAWETCPQSVQGAWDTSRKAARALDKTCRSLADDPALTSLHGSLK